MDFIWVIVCVLYLIWQVFKESPSHGSAIIGWIGILICFVCLANTIDRTHNLILYIPALLLCILLFAYPIILAYVFSAKRKRRDEVMHWLDEHPPTNQELANFRSTYESYELSSGKQLFRSAEEWQKAFEHNPNSLDRHLALRKWKEVRASEILSERRKAKWKL